MHAGVAYTVSIVRTLTFPLAKRTRRLKCKWTISPSQTWTLYIYILIWNSPSVILFTSIVFDLRYMFFFVLARLRVSLGHVWAPRFCAIVLIRNDLFSIVDNVRTSYSTIAKEYIEVHMESSASRTGANLFMLRFYLTQIVIHPNCKQSTPINASAFSFIERLISIWPFSYCC